MEWNMTHIHTHGLRSRLLCTNVWKCFQLNNSLNQRTGVTTLSSWIRQFELWNRQNVRFELASTLLDVGSTVAFSLIFSLFQNFPFSIHFNAHWYYGWYEPRGRANNVSRTRIFSMLRTDDCACELFSNF